MDIDNQTAYRSSSHVLGDHPYHHTVFYVFRIINNLMLIDRYRLFIFDWDGTLATSTSLVRATRLMQTRYNVGKIAARRANFKPDEETELTEAVKLNRLYAFIYELYSTLYKPRLKPGALEILKILKTRGKKVAIFSDANKHRLQIEARKLGVVDYADFLLSAASIRKFKPDPTGITKITELFNCDKRECIYIGDMAVDAFVAEFAGVTSCVVSDGVDPYDVLKSAKPDYIVSSLSAIKDIK